MPRRKKMRSSWGTVEDYGDGRHRLRWLEWHGNKRVRASKTMRCPRREADRELARLQTIHDHPRDMVMCPTFEQCWKEWYEPECKRRIEEGSLKGHTFKIYENLWKNRLSPKWKDVELDAVTSSEWQQWLLTFPGSTARVINVLAGNLVQCAKLHDVRGIEFTDVPYRLSKRQKAKNDDIYSLDELIKIADAVCGSVCEVPMLLMGFGSCRTGEACAAKLEDFHMLEISGQRVAVVQIRRQIGEVAGDFSTPKTADSTRPVIVPWPWSKRLLEIANKQKSLGLIWLNDDGTGNPVSRFRVRAAWKRALKAAGICFLPLTKLRNSWETMSRWKLKIDKDKIDKMMGHTSSDVRAKHYDRPDEEVFAETVVEAWRAYRAD